MSGFFSNFLEKIGLQSDKKEIERNTDKIEQTQNTSKTDQKAESAEFNQPSHTKNTIETTKLEKLNPQPADSKDRVVRVFVSSTFKDMIEDRNELMSRVWPALRKTCRGRAVEFVDIDLRWGITEEQSQRKETLRHCLAEIKRCRPYFIGLLGERYGKVPDEEKYSPALLDEESWLRSHVAKRSVTELEIIHGVLNDPDMARRAFFYFRDPKYAQDRGGDFLANDVDTERLSALKEQVRSVCEAKHIPLRENYADPQALAVLVLADLTAAIDAEFQPDQVPDVWMREERDHEAYAKSRRTKFYVGRNAYFDRLNAFARDGAEGCGMIVLGESGGGKSALLANWVARWRQANPEDFIFQHFTGSSPMSASHLSLMRRLMVSIVRWCSDDDATGSRGLEEEKIPAQAEEIVRVFPEYLDRLAVRAHQKGVGAILVLDALNQLEDRERGRLLAWLPYRLPGELRLVVSTLHSETLNALQPRGWLTLSVEPLTPEERVRLIASYLKHFSQELSEPHAKKIAKVEAASNPLYITTLLHDLRATGDRKRLDAQIAEYLEAVDIPSLLVKILTRYERDYERDRPGLVRESMSLIWAARCGLTEPELLQVLKQEGKESLPTAFWSPVRCALEDGLVDRDGVLAFAHKHLRDAVEKRYVSDDGTAKTLRLRLADQFEALTVDARQADELPWMLRQIEACDRLRVCLLDIERFLLILRRDEDELRSYWIWLQEERKMGKAYLESFESWSGKTDRNRDISYAAGQLAFFLYNAALHTEAETLMRRALKFDEQSFGENHPNVAIRLNNLAQILQATNRLAEAEPLMQRAFKIIEQSFGENHPNVAIYLNNMAQLFKDTNRLAEAEPLIQRALKIDKQSFGENHPNVARHLNNLAALLQATNRLAEAEPLMLRTLKIDEQSFGENHPDVAKDLNNLAALLQATNRFAEAEPLMRRALKIDEQNFGENHPNVARNLNNLAALLQATNRLAEAEPLMQRALKINEQSFGENHPNVTASLNSLAVLYQSHGKYAEAEPFFRRALAIYEKVYGQDHTNVATFLNNLAELLRVRGKYAEAEPLYRRSLTIYENVQGQDHPNMATSLNNLALLYESQGKYAEAEPFYRRALAIKIKVHGQNHPDVATSLNNLAELFRDQGKHAEAELLHRQALAIREKILGSVHPDVALSLNNIAGLLRLQGKYAEAELLYRQGLKIEEKALGNEHSDVATTLHNLAVLYHFQGKYAEAEPLYRRALEIKKKAFGSDHPSIRIICRGIEGCQDAIRRS